jgi:SLOG cluster4 family
MSHPRWVGIVGPTNTALIEETAELPPGVLEKTARDIGTYLAEQSLPMACVPVKGVPLWALEAYHQAGGTDSLALWPGLGDQFEEGTQTSPGKPELAGQMRDDLTWAQEPFELAKTCRCMIAIGLSCGTMVEIIATKWLKRRPVLCLSHLMTAIPPEIAAELNIRYCDSVAHLKKDLLILENHILT